jgi:SecD/SecF fusion protein
MGGGAATVLPAALTLFTIALAIFGGLSHGFYEYMSRGNTWAAVGFLVALFGSMGVLISSLRGFFGKFSGKLVFAMWLIAVLGSYFGYLFHTGKYPMGIDLAGGTELTYRLDFTATKEKVAALTAKKNAASEADAKKLENEIQSLEGSMRDAPDKAAEVLRRRVDPTGTKGIPVTTLAAGTSDKRLRIQLPKATIEEVNRIENAIKTQGVLTFHLVATEQKIIEETKNSPNRLSNDGEWELKEMKEVQKFGKQGSKITPVVIRRRESMRGSNISRAYAARSKESGGWEVRINFDSQGATEFGLLTTANVGKRMAIVLDGIVYSDPNINEPITGGSCQITGSFDQKKAEDLSSVLTAGSLPAEVRQESRFDVGPSLGAEQIRSGMIATAIGTGVVMLFMVVIYRLAGFIAGFCTLLNILMLLGAMGFFKATLTLPGIAGIVLTLGMAVDANVLIFERLREESDRGRPLRLAVSHGFDRAFITIMDCNLTTLISGIVLYYLGTGPVRGFAVSLSIGILTTLFCNLWLNWIMMEWIVSRDILQKLTMMELFKTPKIDFMGMRKFWLVFTGSTALVCVALFFSSKNIYDVDFTGGTLVQFNFKPGSEQSDTAVREKIERQVAPKIQAAVDAISPNEKLDLTVQSFGQPADGGKYRSYTITTRSISEQVDEKVKSSLKAMLTSEFKNELEPSELEEKDGALLVRLLQSDTLTSGEQAKANLEKSLGNAISESGNKDLFKELSALSVKSVAQSGRYFEATLAPLPENPGVRSRLITALQTTKAEGRAEGPISRENTFGSQVANEMKGQSLLALILANLAVFVYVWFRFEFSAAWGVGALVALVHDVVIAAGAVVVLNLLGMPLFINLNIVAALLTITGFSVNDTIVTFDRIREVKAAHPTRAYEDIVNEAVNATLSRTILTSATVLLADISLLIFGGPTIRDMALTLLFGFIAGVYSSVFIASPILIWWLNRYGTGRAAASTAAARPVPDATGAQV